MQKTNETVQHPTRFFFPVQLQENTANTPSIFSKDLRCGAKRIPRNRGTVATFSEALSSASRVQVSDGKVRSDIEKGNSHWNQILVYPVILRILGFFKFRSEI